MKNQIVYNLYFYDGINIIKYIFVVGDIKRQWARVKEKMEDFQQREDAIKGLLSSTGMTFYTSHVLALMWGF